MALTLGLAAGWFLARGPAPALHASGGSDRLGESATLTGQIGVRYSEGLKVPVALDAVYYLDYRAGKLLANVPSFRKTPAGTTVLGEFAERDLLADFRLEPGSTPHFLMTVAAIGGYDEAWQPLLVFESSTGRVATYRVQEAGTADDPRPNFELLDIRPFAKRPAPR